MNKRPVPTVVTVSTLIEEGFARSTIYDRCQPGGPWQLILPTVVLLSNVAATEEDRVQAALLYAGESALLTGLSAARRHGLRTATTTAPVHVLVPARRQPRSVGFVIVERTWRLPPRIVCDGFPCAPVPRAILDGARRLRDVDQIRGLLLEGVQKAHCAVPQLAAELGAGGQHGSSRPRRVVAELLTGVRSVAECHARGIVRLAGLPEPEWNSELVDSAGRVVAVPDAWWDEVGLAWEIDSHEYHLGPDDHRRTLRRNTRYATAGIPFLQTAPSRLISEPRRVAAELRASFTAAAQETTPRLRSRRVAGRSDVA